jgi:hypothetical protein
MRKSQFPDWRLRRVTPDFLYLLAWNIIAIDITVESVLDFLLSRSLVDLSMKDIDHRLSSRRCGRECAAGGQMQATADDHEQEDKQQTTS